MTPEESKAEAEEMQMEAWKQEWQALGGRDGFAQELAARVERDGRRLRHALAREVASALVSTGVCVWLLVWTRGELVVAGPAHLNPP